MVKPHNYIRALVPSYMFGTKRTKDILNVNPTSGFGREDAESVSVYVYNYDAKYLEEIIALIAI